MTQKFTFPTERPQFNVASFFTHVLDFLQYRAVKNDLSDFLHLCLFCHIKLFQIIKHILVTDTFFVIFFKMANLGKILNCPRKLWLFDFCTCKVHLYDDTLQSFLHSLSLIGGGKLPMLPQLP